MLIGSGGVSVGRMRCGRLTMRPLLVPPVLAVCRRRLVVTVRSVLRRHVSSGSRRKLEHPTGADHRRVGQCATSSLRLADVDLEDLSPVERVAEVALGEPPKRLARLNGDADGIRSSVSVLVSRSHREVSRRSRRVQKVVATEQVVSGSGHPAQRDDKRLRLSWRPDAARRQSKHHSGHEAGHERL